MSARFVSSENEWPYFFNFVVSEVTARPMAAQATTPAATSPVQYTSRPTTQIKGGVLIISPPDSQKVTRIVIVRARRTQAIFTLVFWHQQWLAYIFYLFGEKPPLNWFYPELARPIYTDIVVPDVIMCAQFRTKIFRGYDFTEDRICVFPVDLFVWALHQCSAQALPVMRIECTPCHISVTVSGFRSG